MRALTSLEICQISGGYQHNFYDSIMVSGAFSAIFSTVGAVAGVFWYLECASRAYPLTTVFASIQGQALVTLPVAVCAGIGVGGCLGAIVGMGLYHTGVITRPE